MHRFALSILTVCMVLTACSGSGTSWLAPVASGSFDELPARWQAFARLIEQQVLDDTLNVTVRDGIERFLAQYPGYSLSEWQFYYIKNYHMMTRDGPGPEKPDRPIYWAVLTFEQAGTVRRAVISVEPSEMFGSRPLVLACNDLADIIMSRIFGGPSYGDTLRNPIWCRDRNGTLASTLFR